MGISMSDDDQDIQLEVFSPRSEISQLVTSLIELAMAIDVSRDPEARAFLVTAMSGITYMVNPPKGKIYDIKAKKSSKDS